jgi:hypothetical protein
MSKVGSADAAAPAETALYSDKRSLGPEFGLALVGGGALSFGCWLGFTFLGTMLWRGIVPISKIGECPTSTSTTSMWGTIEFGPGTVFYDGCFDVNSSAYRNYNAGLPNVTHSVSGWFGSVDWTRENYRQKSSISGTAFLNDVPTVYEQPFFRPFWDEPSIAYMWTSIIPMLLGFLQLAYSCYCGTVQATVLVGDRVVVTWFGGVRTEVPLCALAQGDPKKHDSAGLPPARDGALVLKTTETVAFASAKVQSGTSTRLKGDTASVRAEPSDPEAFLAALRSAREDAPKREHLFADEMPALAGAGSEGVVMSDVPKHSFGYWVT